MLIKNNFFFEWYEGQNKKTPRKLRLQWKLFFWLVFFSIFIWSFISIYQSFNSNGTLLFYKNIKDFFYFQNNSKFPSYNLWELSFALIWKTIKYVLIGNTLGFAFALISAFLSARNLYKKYYYFIFKIIFILIKSLPIWVFLYAFQISLNKDVAAIAIIFWFTFLWNQKYILEIIENTEITSYWNSVNRGNSKIYAFWKEVFPRMNNKIFALFFLSFESNLLWTTILSGVGLVGIGELIHLTYSDPIVGLKALGIPVFSLLLVVFIFELIILFFNKYVFKIRSKKHLRNPDLTFSKITKIIISLFLLILFIYFLVDVKWDKFDVAEFNNYFNNLFLPNWNILSREGHLENPLLMLLSLFQQAYVVIVLSFILGFLMALVFNENLNNKLVYLSSKGIITLFRIFPSIALIFIFSPLFGVPHLLLVCYVLILNISAIFAKQFSEIINKLDWNIYNSLRMQKWSKYKIIKDWILPSTKKEIFKIIIFRFENILRSLIFLGLYGGSFIGFKLKIFIEPGPSQSIHNFATIIWMLFIIFFLIEILSLQETKLIINKIKNTIMKTKLNKRIFRKKRN